jgi:hypothetical protein
MTRFGFLLVASLLVGCSNSTSNGSDASTDGSSDADADANADADAGNPVNQCVPSCNVASDCSDAGTYDCFNGECVECSSNTTCAALGPSWSCDTTHHRCVQCKTNADCPTQGAPSTNKCGALGFCDYCTTDGDCTVFNSPQQSKCTSLHTCGACKTNADCAGTIPGGCDQTVGACVGCVTDQDCCIVSGVTPCPLHCNTSLGTCTCNSAGACMTAFPTFGPEGCFPAL